MLSLSRNEGFSRAVNRAARAAAGDVIVLVNDDCICEPGFADTLSAAIDAASARVMAAGVLLERSDPTLIDSAGIELDDTLLVFDYLNGMPLSALEGAAPPVGPSGAAAAFDRTAFLELGGFDEAFFAYWEDVDLALRFRLAGASCVAVPGARAVHAHSSTLGSGSRRKNYLVGYGRGYLLRKWGVLGDPGRLAVVPRELAICAAQLAVDGTISGLGGRLSGWRAAANAPTFAYPGAVVGRRRALFEELRRRGGRRRRLGAAVEPS